MSLLDSVEGRQSLSRQVPGREKVGARFKQYGKSDCIIDCIVTELMAEGSVAVTTLNGVGNRTDVPVAVTKSPSVVRAESTEYAAIIR